MLSTSEGLNSVCQLGSMELSNSARWIASENCVGSPGIPTLPSCSYLNFWKLGEFSAGCTNLVASTVSNNVPSAFNRRSDTDTILVGIVVRCPSDGSLPTIVYGNVTPLKVNDRVKFGIEITLVTPPGLPAMAFGPFVESSATTADGTL